MWFALNEFYHYEFVCFFFKLIPSLFSYHQFPYYVHNYILFYFYLFFVIFLGYGDIFPETVPAKILTSIIVLLGFSLIPAQVSDEKNDMVIVDEEKRENREGNDRREYINKIKYDKTNPNQPK